MRVHILYIFVDIILGVGYSLIAFAVSQLLNANFPYARSILGFFFSDKKSVVTGGELS